MPEKQPQHFSNTFLGITLVGLLITLFGGAGVMYYLGVFTTVEVTQQTAPSYRIAYLFHTGPYNEIEPSIKQAGEYLNKAGIKTDTPCAILLDDTGSVAAAKRRSKVGYLVKRGDFIPVQLDEEIFPPRNVVRVVFSGGTLLGSYKAYEGMKAWAKDHHFTLVLPAIEIYHPDGGTEYQLGIIRP